MCVDETFVHNYQDAILYSPMGSTHVSPISKKIQPNFSKEDKLKNYTYV